jgi:hypothetical protein
MHEDRLAVIMGGRVAARVLVGELKGVGRPAE